MCLIGCGGNLEFNDLNSFNDPNNKQNNRVRRKFIERWASDTFLNLQNACIKPVRKRPLSN